MQSLKDLRSCKQREMWYTTVIKEQPQLIEGRIQGKSRGPFYEDKEGHTSIFSVEI